MTSRFVLLFLIVLLPMPARADDDVASARDHYQRGKRAYDIGHFEEAAREYERAYQLKDDPALLYNLGQAHRLANHHSQALIAYKAYLRNVPNTPYRSEVESRIAELQALVDAQAQQQQQKPLTLKDGTSATAPTATATEIHTSKPDRPLYKRGWLWGAVVGGVVVVAGAITLGVVLGSPKDPSPTLGTAGARGF
jgi:tetratricopeptide (TPR) repeat protein